jgi:polysaccharide chain length determinant protein (PEP-CTERM system associated)
LSGKRRGGSNIYELSYEGKSPEMVYQVVSKLLNTLIENTLDSARSDTATAQQFLDNQINEYENRLTVAEQKLAEFKRANVGVMPDEKGGYYTRLQREEAKLDNIRSKLRLEKRRYSAMLKQLEGEAPLLGSGSYGSSKVAKLRKYREQLEYLLTQYEEQHPDVRALRATIAELVASNNAVDDEYVDTGSGELVEFNPVYQDLKAEIHKSSIEVETMKIQLAEQENTVQSLKRDVDVLPGVEAGLAKLNRDYEITRERYLSLVTRRESARLTQAIGQSGSNIKFRIIDPPRVPMKPSGPNRLLYLTGVFLIAIAAGLGWGFLRYLLQPTLIDSSQVREKIGFPLLGSVSLYLRDEHKLKRRLQLAGFLAVFSLLVITYGAAMFFNETGSKIVNAYIMSRSAVL